MRVAARAFLSAGLFAMAVPGLLAVQADSWQIIGTGVLAGLLAAVIDPGRKP